MSNRPRARHDQAIRVFIHRRIKHLNAFGQRSDFNMLTLFRIGRVALWHNVFANRRFLRESIAVTLFVMYQPTIRVIFGLVPLKLTDWMICVGATSLNLVYMEMVKLFRRNIEKNNEKMPIR